MILFNTKNSNVPMYSGASQDEITFIEMCRDSNIAHFIKREQDLLKIQVKNDPEEYKIIRTIEFTSDRKMMSVIVKRLKDGKYINFVKGADMAIVPRLLNRDSDFDDFSIH